jgi:hypothetical protein
MRRWFIPEIGSLHGLMLLLVTGALFAARAERINQDGRILGTLPPVTNSILFNTSASDAIVSAMQIFPISNAWNETISNRPLLANSAGMIANITNALATNRQSLWLFTEMNFVLVPDAQPPIPIDFFNYADESDPSPYPVATNTPVETWPVGTGSLTLSEWQQDINNKGGDRHAIIVMPGSNYVWETWLTKRIGTNWQASNGAKFDMNSNALRPTNWTSGDAGGLSMFAGLIRYDECQRGMVEHAIRLIVPQTRAASIYPATHKTGSSTDTNRPAMGQRFRLKSNFNITTNFTTEEKAVLLALKKYGAIVADNGGFFSMSRAPDDRFSANAFSHITSSVYITNFEVIQTTGSTEGPRSAGAPSANAGADFMATVGVPANLSGAVVASNTASILWKHYSGPGTVTFGNPTNATTTSTFSVTGNYILELSADDGVHSVAYDAVIVNVVAPILLSASASGTNILLNWTGGVAPFVVEQSTNLNFSNWTAVVTNNSSNVVIPILKNQAFYRVRTE